MNEGSSTSASRAAARPQTLGSCDPAVIAMQVSDLIRQWELVPQRSEVPSIWRRRSEANACRDCSFDCWSRPTWFAEHSCAEGKGMERHPREGEGRRLKMLPQPVLYTKVESQSCCCGGPLEGNVPRGCALPPGRGVSGECGGHPALPRLLRQAQWPRRHLHQNHRGRDQSTVSRPRPDLGQTMHRGIHAIQLRSHLVLSVDL